ncbi:MAG TPA: substrate-binding domain-containing protein, partial [Bacillota bacterium]|nr:substrate-binding domain-containing protein [Bacillota bacterium]
MKSNQSNQITIGALLQSIKYNNVNMERYLGIVKIADELDVNVIFYVQGDRGEPENHNICNYFLKNKVQGLIISISEVYSNMNFTDLKQFYQSFNIPIVSLSEQWENCSNILFDNYAGMRDVVKHLIDVHNMKKIFFLRGPQSHEIAQKRFQAYCDVMEEYGYYNDKLISLPVSWGIRDGTTSFNDLISGLEPGKDFEAIVSVNDHWAVEASNRLQQLGIKIPEDVAVFGFNDTQDAKINIPPLSTVALPFRKQGELAVKKLVELIQGVSGVSDLVVPAKIVLRHSCGCGYLNINSSSQNLQQFEYQGRNLKKKIIQQIDQILSEENPHIETRLGAKLLKTFLADINNESKNSFLGFLESKVTEWCQNEKQFMAWQNVIIIIRENLNVLTESNQKETAERILHQAGVHIGLTALRINENQTYWERDIIRLISEFQSYLGNAFNQSELINLLNEFSPQVGVQSCYIVFFEEPQPYIYPQQFPEWSRLILGYNRNRKIDCGPEGIRFPAKQLFLDEWLSYDIKYNMTYSPFFYKEYQFGYGIFEIPSHVHTVFRNLIQQIRSSLWGIYLFNQQKHAEEYLTQQTLQLSRSN